MNKQIIEQARQELMAERVAIDNALNSLARVQDGTLVVETLAGWGDKFEAAGRKIVREVLATDKKPKRKGKTKPVIEGKNSWIALKLKPGSSQGPTKIDERASVGARANFAAVPRVSKLTDAIRTVAGGMDRDAKFTRASMQEEILKRWPAMKDKMTAISVNLIDMMNRGELRRTGTGSNAVYTVAKLKEVKTEPGPILPTSSPTQVEGAAVTTGFSPKPKGPSAKEVAYQQLRGEITVPRDADQEGDR